MDAMRPKGQEKKYTDINKTWEEISKAANSDKMKPKLKMMERVSMTESKVHLNFASKQGVEVSEGTFVIFPDQNTVRYRFFRPAGK